MMFVLSPYELRWDEVDPARHAFDDAAAEQVVRSLGPALRVPRQPDKSGVPPASANHRANWLWADAMSQALVDHYGRWVLGWRWSNDEGDYDGGPIASWCCPPHSVADPEPTVARVVEALREWRGWLEELAGWFDAYPLDLASVEDQRLVWEAAARNVILQVVDRTGCGSGWHGHCRQVLTWFLARWGLPDWLCS